MDDKQEAYSMDLILSLSELYHKLIALDDSSLSNPKSVAADIKEFRDTIRRLKLQDSYHRVGGKLTQLHSTFIHSEAADVKRLRKNLPDLVREVRCVMVSVQGEAERQILYPVIPGSSFTRFEAPDFMDPPIPLIVERFLEHARQCWVVGFEPAAVMHTLLATEVLTRHFCRTAYKKFLYRKTWGDVVRELPESALKDLLNHIVDDYRNKIMHGKCEVDFAMAIDVFADCAMASEDMIAVLRKSEGVRSTPLDSEQDAIMMTVSCIKYKYETQETLIQILMGISAKHIQANDWDELPTFGVFRDCSYPWVQDKVDWLRHNHRLGVKYEKHKNHSYIDYADDSVRRETNSFWATKLLVWADQKNTQGWLKFLDWILKLPKGVKKAFLEKICADSRVDLDDVLEYWFERESEGRNRTEINKTRQTLGLEAIPHSRYIGN
jgi:hypothetical protein